jgi:hypothetical protein
LLVLIVDAKKRTSIKRITSYLTEETPQLSQQPGWINAKKVDKKDLISGPGKINSDNLTNDGIIQSRAIVKAMRRPTPVHRTPGHMGFATVGNGLVLDPDSTTPKVKEMSHGPFPGGRQSGDLPIFFSSLGPSPRP